MSENNPLKVAIVGGGIAGLALAVGMAKKPHVDVHVYESVPAYKDVGAGLALHLNAINAMGLIGPELKQAYFDKALSMGEEDQEMATEVILAQGEHKGQLVAELGRAKGRKTVSRSDLLDGFLTLIPKERISFGKRLVSIDQPSRGRDGIDLTFQDGTKVKADCLLAADGVHSTTRSFLLGPRGHVNCIPLNKNTRLSAGVAVRGAAAAAFFSEDDGKAPPLDPALYADYSEDAQRIVRLVARDTSASWTAADHDHAPFYVRDRVAVFGDAAHAALPFAGNGAAQALEDAAVLDSLFDHVAKPEDVERALVAYDRVRRPRSQKMVELARQFGRIYAYADEGRFYENPEMMRRFFQSMAEWTNAFDVARQNESAVGIMTRGCDCEYEDEDSV
ncbi:hypothetical protein M426DRAFT_53190 [Hypoxylon sp. CI-4A]|nr:hypothetical protein M426DRAFT_53190 [Hypoxylon sp. CI-4A]